MPFLLLVYIINKTVYTEYTQLHSSLSNLSSFLLLYIILLLLIILLHTIFSYFSFLLLRSSSSPHLQSSLLWRHLLASQAGLCLRWRAHAQVGLLTSTGKMMQLPVPIALFLSCCVVIAQGGSENTIFNVLPTLYQQQGEWGTDRLAIKTQLVHANDNVSFECCTI